MRQSKMKSKDKQDAGMFFFEHENTNKIIRVKLNLTSNNLFKESEGKVGMIYNNALEIKLLNMEINGM